MDSIDAAELALSLPEVDPSRPSVARIYDFWLGGSQNFEADREAGRRAAEAMPTLPTWARANRVFLRHVVGELVGRYGITQFLDLGSGIPTSATSTRSRRRRTARCRLRGRDPWPSRTPGDAGGQRPAVHAHGGPAATAGRAASDVVTKMLDLSKPVAVLMSAVLHFIEDDAEAAADVRAFAEHASPAATSPSPTAASTTPTWRRSRTRPGLHEIHRRPVDARSPARQVAPWLDGLEIMPPGLVNVDVWLPSLRVGGNPAPPSLGVLARK